MHKWAGNAVTDGYTIVLGNGATQLVRCATRILAHRPLCRCLACTHDHRPTGRYSQASRRPRAARSRCLHSLHGTALRRSPRNADDRSYPNFIDWGNENPLRSVWNASLAQVHSPVRNTSSASRVYAYPTHSHSDLTLCRIRGMLWRL